MSGDKIEIIVNCPRETDPIWQAGLDSLAGPMLFFHLGAVFWLF
jgi:hypothetical protein